MPTYGRGTNYQPGRSLVDRLIAAGIYTPPGEGGPPTMPPVSGRPGSLFASGRFDDLVARPGDPNDMRQLPAGPDDPMELEQLSSVQGAGLPPDPEADMALTGLREAQGNLAPMLSRYGLGGSGNIDRSGGRTSVTIHGDPVESEASRVRMLRDRARQSGDLNRTLASAKASMIADSRRMDPIEAARGERESVVAADMASPEMPDAGLPTAVESLAALRAILDRARVGRQVTREGTVDSARTFMDPTVTEARGVARSEANETSDREIMGRIRAQLAGNPEAAFMPELRRFLGLDDGTGAGDVGAGAADTMTQQELMQFATEAGMTPDEARVYVMRHGIQVQ